MADFSLTTLFVVPVAQGNTFPSSGSTQDLTAGQVGVADNAYLLVNDLSSAPYWYIAQGRTNTYLQGSKRSDKIKGCEGVLTCRPNVTEWYMVHGCPTPVNQITDITDWHVKCGDVVTVTIRAFSNYINTLYFNGLTRSVTVQAPCCDCGGDICDELTGEDLSLFITSIIDALELAAPGINPDNIILTTFFTFTNVAGTTLRITGKALTAYGVPCDVAAFPHEFDRLWFRTFVYAGPATTADFIVSDACNIVADSTIMQVSNYAAGTSAEIKQLEKNYYSYQAGYLKHLYRMAGFNQNFESWVSDGTTYDTFYIKFNEIDKSAYSWGDYIEQDSLVIIAAPTGAAADALKSILETGLGSITSDTICITTTAPSTTTTTTSGT